MEQTVCNNRLSERGADSAVRLRPWRMAATVPKLLASAHKWELVQRFKRGILLSSTDSHNGGGATDCYGDGKESAAKNKALLFIGTDDTSAGPFHLQLTAPQFAQLSIADTQGFWSVNGLLATNGIIIETEALPIYEVEAPTLVPRAISFAGRELSAYLASSSQNTGLGLAPLDLLAPNGPLPYTSAELATELAREESRQEAWQKLVYYLVGRGQGLTPSGDDFLVGMMAVISDPILQAAVAARAAYTEATGIVSRAYFSAAAQRHFDEDVCRMLAAANRCDAALFARLCARIAQHGHSSGIDLLCGTLYALYTLGTRHSTLATRNATLELTRTEALI